MLKERFRKYLPVVVDLETGGFDSNSNAILEIAITLIEEEDNQLVVGLIDSILNHMKD
jgi:ribonuclease T